MSGPLVTSAAAVLGAMLALWALSLRLKDASIVDAWWGPGFGLAVGAALAAAGAPSWRGWLVLGLTLAWGLRLGAHIFTRNRGHGEDPRYRAMRRRHGERFGLVSLITVFGLQGVLMWTISLPLQMAALSAAPLGWLDAAGVAIWAGGLTLEAVADAQLRRFKADASNRGRILDSGLWAWSRHPNYFGEAVLWWGLYLIAVAAGAWWTVFAPALMTFLLVKVSGVALLEKHMSERPGYREYVERTPAFIMRPPSR